MSAPRAHELNVSCHRCGREFDPERADLDGWVVLDAREDGWTLVACPACQTESEMRVAAESSD